MVSVAKKSKDKISVGGRKFALRRRDARGVAEAEVVGIGSRPSTTATTARCSCPWSATARSSAGSRSRTPGPATWRSRDELPLHARQLSKGEPAIETIHLEA